MGNCIICGTPVDGSVCASHEEDVAFVFEGDAPSQLVPGRYYRGRVDGYADFGVFVDVGDHVTGLLHRSELDRRLESLDLEPGDAVYVQVLDVRDNGNVDLGWSIRQAEREFRGALVQTADGTTRPPEGDDGSEESTDADRSATNERTAANGGSATNGGSASSAAVAATADESAAADLTRAAIDSIDDRVGSVVRLEGEIVGVRQTAGPTVFELRDETATVECAAFEEAGVRAFFFFFFASALSAVTGS